MAHPARVLLLGAAVVLCLPGVVHAGMPTFHLTDMASMRIQTISFFLMGLLIASGFIQRLWNYLHKDFSFLPRLTYGKALGVVVLWGLLFVLVLTMISGARELMTPGAWEKHGKTYRLANQSEAPPAEILYNRDREKKLELLRTALWAYAKSHDGRFPLDQSAIEIPKSLWQVTDPSGMAYLYIGGQAANQGHSVLAYEPEIYGSERVVLFTNGEIKRLESAELLRLLPEEKK